MVLKRAGGYMWPFTHNLKSNEYLELLEKINILSTKIASLEIDLQLYVKKLKASKGLKELEKEEPEDLNKSVLLTEDGKSASTSRIGHPHGNR